MKRIVYFRFAQLALLALMLSLNASAVRAQTTVFTYQGVLNVEGSPANGTYDLQFKLFDTITAGTGAQQGPTIPFNNIPLSGGAISIQLDFGAAAFPGANRYLEIGIRRGADPDTAPFTILGPRQWITSSPYAIKSLAAASADALSPTAGAGYIRNTTSQQAGASFNISGSGTAGGTLTAGAGVFGSLSGSGAGVSGKSASGAGVSGESTNGTAMFGFSNSGTGVFGQAFGPSGIGVKGESPSGYAGYFSGKVRMGNNQGFYMGNPSGADKRVLLADSNILRIGAGGGQGFDRIDFDLGTFGTAMTLLGNGNVNIGGNVLLGNNRGIYMKNTSQVDKRVLLADTSNPNILHIGSGGGQGFDQIDFDLGNSGNVMTLVNGRAKVKVLEISGADVAEPFDVSGVEAIEPGMVVAIDPDHPGKLRVADKAYDRAVAGIVSGANGIRTGLTLRQEGTIADGSHPVALTGRVYCWADASNGPIEPGDLLTTSNLPGHAMKVTDHAKAQGAIIGKAMTGLKSGKGLVLVLVSLQ